MSSYCHCDFSVNHDIPPVYVGPSEISPPKPDHPGCQVIMYSGYTEFKQPLPLKVRKCEGQGIRNAITKFSSRSRNNLLKKLFSLPKPPTLFITLTYQYYPADSKEWKRHLDNFRRRFYEKFPKAWFYWKLEPQKEGAPHYHLIGDLNADVNIHALRWYVSRLWYEVCGTGSLKHFKYGTQVKIIKDSKNAMQGYVCKYVGKTDATEYAHWAHPGRFWGIFGRENLPEGTLIAITMAKQEYYIIRRLVRRWLKHKSYKCHAYARRLARISSFFVLISREVVDRFLDLVLGPVPFAI
jgi:hypothetical protein